jgi:hsp70-interacting protein
MADWPGLLKWSLNHTDGTTPTQDIKPMDKATQKWLEEAIETYTIDEVSEMGKIVKYLQEGEKGLGPQEEDEIAGNLEILENLTEGVENARNLVKIGGFKVLINTMLNSMYDKVRRKACYVFASCCQNNTFVQVDAMKNGAFNLFAQVMKEQKMENKEMAFSALSSFLRGENLQGKRDFIDADGVEFILELISNNDKFNSIKLKTKAVLLLNDMMYYDDKLHYAVMGDFLKEKEAAKVKQPHKKMPTAKVHTKPVNNVQAQQNNNATDSNLASYTFIVRRKLIAGNFLEKAVAAYYLENLKPTLDFRVQVLGIILALLHWDKKVKLTQGALQHLISCKDYLIEVNKTEDHLFDNEIQLLNSIIHTSSTKH